MANLLKKHFAAIVTSVLIVSSYVMLMLPVNDVLAVYAIQETVPKSKFYTQPFEADVGDFVQVSLFASSEIAFFIIALDDPTWWNSIDVPYIFCINGTDIEKAIQIYDEGSYLLVIYANATSSVNGKVIHTRTLNALSWIVKFSAKSTSFKLLILGVLGLGGGGMLMLSRKDKEAKES